MSEKNGRPAVGPSEKAKGDAPIAQAPAAPVTPVTPVTPAQTPYFRDGNKIKEDKASETASKK